MVEDKVEEVDRTVGKKREALYVLWKVDKS
jgi:hypothetical protein